LPLLVGDDLRGPDRRRVERHLIGCPHCRQHQAALSQALETLRTVAAATPVQAQADAPSLWPALARQIRESGRPVPAATFSFSLPLPLALVFSWLRANPRPALGLGLSLGLLATLGISLVTHQHSATAQPPLRAHEHPTVAVRDGDGASAKPQPQPIATPAPSSTLPALIVPPVVDNSNPPPSPRLDLDNSLEHGRPMPHPQDRDTRDRAVPTY
jgi:anti-sigma factor RsiW